MIIHPQLRASNPARFPWAARLRKKTSGLGVFKPGREELSNDFRLISAERMITKRNVDVTTKKN